MPNVFFVHGLFLHGFAMKYLASHFKKSNYQTYAFSYPTLRNNLAQNAELLGQYIQKNTTKNSINYFVGHSLGGLVIRKTYEAYPHLFNGAIVTLGSPHNGSLVANQLVSSIHSKIIGNSFQNALDGNLPEWQGKIPLGSIAGTKNLGINTLTSTLKSASDGTVSVLETHLPNQTDHICLPLTHNSLLFSKVAVHQVDYFFKHHQFSH